MATNYRLLGRATAAWVLGSAQTFAASASTALAATAESIALVESTNPTARLLTAGRAGGGRTLASSSASAASAASDSSDTSEFQVTIPQALHTDGGYPHREAKFGNPLFNQGGLEMAPLVYYASTLCDDAAVDETESYPPGPWQTLVGSPFVLMIDRGECNFVTKVRNAQKRGANAVVVADNTCLCSDTACTKPAGSECEESAPIMADDGTGSDIVMPSILLTKTDADTLKAYLIEKNGSEQVLVQMKWFMPRPDDRVEWDLWTSPTDKDAERFKQNFYTSELALAEHAFLVPHYRIYQCAQDGTCSTMCTNEGRYCQIDPDGDLDEGLSGADVVVESLRRKCIWNLHAEAVDVRSLDDGSGGTVEVKGGVGEKWWAYVTSFDKACYSGAWEGARFADEGCVAGVMKSAGINQGEVEQCMEDSGGTSSGENSLLEAEMELGYDYNIYTIPSVLVNQMKVFGSITATGVLTAICAGFMEGTEPTICVCASSAINTAAALQTCVADVTRHGGGGGGRHRGGGEDGGVPWWVVLVIVLGMLALGGLGAFLYWRRTQQQMRDQVRGILAEYMPLDDIGGGEGGISTNSFGVQPKPFTEMMAFSGGSRSDDLDGV